MWLAFRNASLRLSAGVPIGAAEKLVVVQEKFRGENALGVELLVKVAGRFGRFTQRVVRLHFLIGEKFFAAGFEIQLVEIAKAAVEHAR